MIFRTDDYRDYEAFSKLLCDCGREYSFKMLGDWLLLLVCDACHEYLTYERRK